MFALVNKRAELAAAEAQLHHAELAVSLYRAQILELRKEVQELEGIL
jgi:hypothetical protein